MTAEPGDGGGCPRCSGQPCRTEPDGMRCCESCGRWWCAAPERRPSVIASVQLDLPIPVGRRRGVDPRRVAA